MSSRTTTSGSATQTSTPKQQTAQPSVASSSPPHEKIAMLAYEKWVKRGCPQGSDKQDWLEAEAELRRDMARPSSTTTAATQRR